MQRSRVSAAFTVAEIEQVGQRRSEDIVRKRRRGSPKAAGGPRSASGVGCEADHAMFEAIDRAILIFDPTAQVRQPTRRD